MPLGDFSSDALVKLVAHYERKHRLVIETTPNVPLDDSVINANRRQVIAEELIALMKRAQPKLANDPQAILIGFTSYDMYIRGKPEWKWAFGMYEDRFGVISGRRMDPRIYPYYYGPRPVKILQAILERYGIPTRGSRDPEVLEVRLRKMATRYIGVLYFHLPQSTSTKSVMYSPILGPEDLDSIGEDF